MNNNEARINTEDTSTNKINERYVRNLGFFCVDEQVRLGSAKIAIAGGGGDGGEIARLIVRTGIGCGSRGEIRLADPEEFGIENTNRQTACNVDTIGKNKAASVGELLRKINPDINLKTYTEGVTEENVEEFIHDADIIIDESDYTRHEIAVMLGRSAIKKRIPVLLGMNIGFGGLVTTMHPDGPSFERQLGFNSKQSIQEIAEQKVPLSRWAPYLPKYGDFKVLTEVADGKKPAPSVATGMSATASVTTDEAMWNLLDGKNHRPKPIYFKKTLVVDPGARIIKTIRFNRMNYIRHGAIMWVRNHTIGYPRTDYDYFEDNTI